MELRQLKTFAAVYQLNSFTKAAGALGYAQSSVTTQIQLLEEELGVKLFERLGKTISLTSAGEKLMPYAKQIIKLSSDAKEAVSDSEVLKGLVTVGSIESLCATRLPEIYKEYHMQHPDVEVAIKIYDHLKLNELLRENIIDVAFFIDELYDDPELMTEVVISESMVILACPGHPLAGKKCVLPEDLEGETFILTEADCSYRKVFERMLSQHRVKAHSIMESGSIQAIKQLAISGLGITFLPQIAVKEELTQKSLSVLKWEGPAFNIMTQLVYHKDKWLSPSLRAFLQLTKKMMKEE